MTCIFSSSGVYAYGSGMVIPQEVIEKISLLLKQRIESVQVLFDLYNRMSMDFCLINGRDIASGENREEIRRILLPYFE